MSNLATLDRTLQTHSEKAKLALMNIRPSLNDVIDYETRKKLSNTKIEPNFDDSEKGNVEDVTILEPIDNKIV